MVYTPHTSDDLEKIFSLLGIDSIDDLYTQIPKDVKLDFDSWSFPSGLSESEALKTFKNLAAKNRGLTAFIGLGAYDHEIPAAVWALAGKAEFATSYTPYQAEASQGMLQAIFEFQSMIAEITGMHSANASVYDGATALAEAISIATSDKRNHRIAVSLGVNPFYREVISTYARAFDIEILWLPLSDGQTDFSRPIEGEVAAYVFQQPNFLGYLEDTDLFQKEKAKSGALGIVSINPILAAVLRKPSEYGADIVCGEGQSLGIPLNCGGPFVGFMATTKKLFRKLPGRIAGLTTDSDSEAAFVLTLQAREQHIRREKASSNICTNQALNALAATIYLSLLGPQGLKEVAHSSINNTHYLAKNLREIGVEVLDNRPFLMEFPVKIAKAKYERLKKDLLKEGFTPPLDLRDITVGAGGFLDLTDIYLLCATEKRTKEEIDAFVTVWEGIF